MLAGVGAIDASSKRVPMSGQLAKSFPALGRPLF